MVTTVGKPISNDLWDHPVLNPWALDAIATRGYDDYGLGIVDEVPLSEEVEPDHESGRSKRSEAAVREAIANAAAGEPDFDPSAVSFSSDPEYVALIQSRAEPGKHRPQTYDHLDADDLPEPDQDDGPEPDPAALAIARARKPVDPAARERLLKDRRNKADRLRRAKRWAEREAAGLRPRGFRPTP